MVSAVCPMWATRRSLAAAKWAAAIPASPLPITHTSHSMVFASVIQSFAFLIRFKSYDQRPLVAGSWLSVYGQNHQASIQQRDASGRSAETLIPACAIVENNRTPRPLSYNSSPNNPQCRASISSDCTSCLSQSVGYCPCQRLLRNALRSAKCMPDLSCL